MAGRTIDHYQIQEKIGEGGMGVVYRAFDTHLQRQVAIKVLSAEAVANPERKRRFVQEARTASALNHPNIITIYDIDAADGVDFIAMEYVSGKTLGQSIGPAGLRLTEALKWAIQIADALAAAHSAGIVHRDLKPGNVMVTEKGLIKVLDFGLAKLTERADINELDPTRSMTLGQALRTEEGTIVGTVAYMSPEQAQGKKVDARSDIFAFGSVLYEMVTGQRAFQADNRISTLAAILHHEPRPVHELAEATPPELEKIITRCLRKDQDRRIQHMGDVKLALEELKEESESGVRAVDIGSQRPRPSRVGIAMALGVILLLAAAGASWWLRRSPAASGVAGSGGPVLTPLTADSGLSCDPALSPDGKLLAYASDRSGEGNLDIWVQQVGGGEPVRLTRHESDDYEPSFSPDGTLIAFCSQREGGGIFVIPALSGEERLIAERGHRPRFSPDGNWIAYRDAGKIYVVPTSGGRPKQLAPEFLNAAYPVWFPDGKRLLFLGNRNATARIYDDWYVAPLDGGPVTGTGALELFRQQGLRGYGGTTYFIPGVWAPAGDALIFSAVAGASTNLWQIRISPETGQLAGAPQQLTFLASAAGLDLQPSAAGAAGSLRVAFWNLEANVDVWSLEIEANQGKPLGQIRRLTRNAASEQWASVSADGKKMVYNVRNQGVNWDVWLKSLEIGRETPLAVGPAAELWPKITRDGSRVAYAVEDGRKQEIHILTLGGAVPEKICEGCTEPWDWSSDGKHLLYRTGLPRKIGVLGSTPGEKIVLDHPKYSLNQPRFSPDDHWIAFMGETGSFGASTLFIAPFRGTAEIPFAEWRAIADGSTYNGSAGWSPDGSLVYFMSERDGSRCLWAQRLDPATKRARGAPFEVQPFHRAQVRSMALWQPGAAGTAMARDKIVFSMVEATGNIWMAQVK